MALLSVAGYPPCRRLKKDSELRTANIRRPGETRRAQASRFSRSLRSVASEGDPGSAWYSTMA
jgi:hypothetical protein